MKKRLLLILALFLLLGFLVRGVIGAPKAANLISPWIERGKTATNLWFPKAEASNGEIDQLTISAKSAYFVDIDTGQVVYQKNPHDRLPIASLTKVMTVILTMENKKLDDEVSISQQAADMEPDHMELIAGEKLSVRELLDGIFLVSANDAAEALAENVFGNRDKFIKTMNDKASQLGMKDSLFINPTGLEEDNREQYSSAYDVALMSRYAIKQFPQLVEISSQPFIFIPQTPTHQDYTLYSGINLLTTYPGVLGFKTGYTPEAGLTLITFASKNGHQVLGVILGSGDRRGEAKELLDYSFKKLGGE